MPKDKTYSIENISEKQLFILQKALEIYSRLGLLQFENAILQDIQFSNDFSYIQNRDTIRMYLKQIRNLLVQTDKFDDLKNAMNDEWSLGINQEVVPKSSKIAVQMEMAIRNGRKMTDDDKKDTFKDLSDESEIIVNETTFRKEKIFNILRKIEQTQL
jgi:hypothetical protein